MDDDGFSDDFLYAESVSEKDRKCVAVISEKRRQVPGVIGMGTVLGIVMSHGLGKGILAISCTGASVVQMKGKDRIFAGLQCHGKSVHFDSHKGAIGSGIKTDAPMNFRIFPAAGDFCPCMWPFIQKGNKKRAFLMVLISTIHKKSLKTFSEYYMQGKSFRFCKLKIGL